MGTILIIFFTLFFLGWIGIVGFPEKKLPMPPFPEKLMKGAEPLFLKGKKNVLCLLCHGYADSPFQMKPLAKHLNRLGYSTHALLLPGHGSTTEEMMKTRYYHWLSHFESLYLDAAKRYTKIILIGQSMGGTLSIQAAVRNAATVQPAAVIAISTPLFFNGFFLGSFLIAKPFMALTGLLKLFFPRLKLKGRSSPLNPYVGYGRDYAIASLHSFKRELHKVRKLLPQLEAPLCTIMSETDRTVPIQNLHYLHLHAGSAIKNSCTFRIPDDETTRHLLITHKNTSRKTIHYVSRFIEDVMKGV